MIGYYICLIGAATLGVLLVYCVEGPRKHPVTAEELAEAFSETY
jgi:hypothetical protein